MFKPSFKIKYSFEHRFSESQRVLHLYPDRIPIICEKSNQLHLPDIDKSKYLVPWDLTIGQFIYVIRQRLHLKPEEAIFLFIGNTMSSSSTIIGELYSYYKDPDGFLYIQYSKENTFGSSLCV